MGTPRLSLTITAIVLAGAACRPAATKPGKGCRTSCPPAAAAVSAKSNASKGDKDPRRWRPSNRDTWCGYATAYHLAVDQSGRHALAAMLATCPAGGA